MLVLSVVSANRYESRFLTNRSCLPWQYETAIYNFRAYFGEVASSEETAALWKQLLEFIAFIAIIKIKKKGGKSEQE